MIAIIIINSGLWEESLVKAKEKGNHKMWRSQMRHFSRSRSQGASGKMIKVCRGPEAQVLPRMGVVRKVVRLSFDSLGTMFSQSKS